MSKLINLLSRSLLTQCCDDTNQHDTNILQRSFSSQHLRQTTADDSSVEVPSNGLDGTQSHSRLSELEDLDKTSDQVYESQKGSKPQLFTFQVGQKSAKECHFDTTSHFSKLSVTSTQFQSESQSVKEQSDKDTLKTYQERLVLVEQELEQIVEILKEKQQVHDSDILQKDHIISELEQHLTMFNNQEKNVSQDEESMTEQFYEDSVVVNDLRAQITILSQKLEELLTERDQLLETVSQVTKSNLACGNEVLSKSKSLADLRQQFDAFVQTSNAMKQNLDLSIQETKQNQKILDIHVSDILRLKAILKDITEENVSQKNQIKTLISEKSDILSAYIKIKSQFESVRRNDPDVTQESIGSIDYEGGEEQIKRGNNVNINVVQGEQIDGFQKFSSELNKHGMHVFPYFQSRNPFSFYLTNQMAQHIVNQKSSLKKKKDLQQKEKQLKQLQKSSKDQEQTINDLIKKNEQLRNGEGQSYSSSQSSRNTGAFESQYNLKSQQSLQKSSKVSAKEQSDQDEELYPDVESFKSKDKPFVKQQKKTTYNQKGRLENGMLGTYVDSPGRYQEADDYITMSERQEQNYRLQREQQYQPGPKPLTLNPPKPDFKFKQQTNDLVFRKIEDIQDDGAFESLKKPQPKFKIEETQIQTKNLDEQKPKMSSLDKMRLQQKNKKQSIQETPDKEFEAKFGEDYVQPTRTLLFDTNNYSPANVFQTTTNFQDLLGQTEINYDARGNSKAMQIRLDHVVSGVSTFAEDSTPEVVQVSSTQRPFLESKDHEVISEAVKNCDVSKRIFFYATLANLDDGTETVFAGVLARVKGHYTDFTAQFDWHHMTFSKGTKSVKLALKSKGGDDLNEQAIAEWAGNYMDFTPYQDDTHHFVSYLPLAPHVTISGESMMSAFFAQSIGGPNNVVYTGGVVFASGDYSANGMIPTDALFKKQKCMNLPLVVVAKYTIKEMVEIQQKASEFQLRVLKGLGFFLRGSQPFELTGIPGTNGYNMLVVENLGYALMMLQSKDLFDKLAKVAIGDDTGNLSRYLRESVIQCIGDSKTSSLVNFLVHGSTDEKKLTSILGKFMHADEANKSVAFGAKRRLLTVLADTHRKDVDVISGIEAVLEFVPISGYSLVSKSMPIPIAALVDLDVMTYPVYKAMSQAIRTFFGTKLQNCSKQAKIREQLDGYAQLSEEAKNQNADYQALKKQLELVNLTYGEKTLPLTSQNLNMILADANISIDKIRSPDYETDEVPDYNTTQLAAVECLSKLITDCGTEFTNIYTGFLGKKSTTQNLNKLLIENSETDFKILNQEFYTEKMAKNLESQVQSKNTKGQKNAKRITESNLPVPQEFVGGSSLKQKTNGALLGIFGTGFKSTVNACDVLGAVGKHSVAIACYAVDALSKFLVTNNGVTKLIIKKNLKSHTPQLLALIKCTTAATSTGRPRNSMLKYDIWNAMQYTLQKENMKDGPGKTAAQQQYDYLMANSDLQPEDILQLLKFAKEPPKPERATQTNHLFFSINGKFYAQPIEVPYPSTSDGTSQVLKHIIDNFKDRDIGYDLKADFSTNNKYTEMVDTLNQPQAQIQKNYYDY